MTEKGGVQSVERIFQLIEQLASHPAGASLQRLAQETGLAKSTEHRLLASQVSLGYADGYDLCRALPGLCGVVAVPLSVFYDDPDGARHLVRFAFCKRDEVLDEAVRRLRTLRG